MTNDTRSAALVVVDMQNDFADVRGSLYVRGAERVLQAVNRAVRSAVDGGDMVVYTQDWHPESTPHFAKDGGTWPVHCVAGTWGAMLHPDLEIASDASYVRKGVGGEDGYSGFSVRSPETGAVSRTELDRLLRMARVGSVTVVGLATDYCVKETVLDARQLGYGVKVLLDGIAPVDLRPGDGKEALDVMRRAGAAFV